MSKARRAARFAAALAMSLALVFAFMPAMGGNAFAEDGVPAPQNVKLNVDTSSAGIVKGYTAEWDAVSGADSYEIAVFQYDSDNDYWSNETNYFEANTEEVAGGRVKTDLSVKFPRYGGTFRVQVHAVHDSSDYDSEDSWETDDGVSNEVGLSEFTFEETTEFGVSTTVVYDSNVTAVAKELLDEEISMRDYISESNGDYFYKENPDDPNEEGQKLICLAPKGAAAYSSKAKMLEDAYYEPPTDMGKTVDSADTIVYAIWEGDFCTDGEMHNWQEITHKGSFTQNGYIEMKCSKCGASVYVSPGGLMVNNVKLEKTSFKCTGKPIKPKVTVENYDGPLAADCYDLIYKNNTNVGTASVTVKLKGPYFEGSKTLTFTITKGVNPLKVSAKTAAVKYSKLKKKAQTLKVSKVIKFANKGQGTLSYKLVSAKKGSRNFKKSFRVAAKTGKVTVKKGLKKGTYKVKVKVKAAGNKNFYAGTKNVTFKVKVK